MFVVTEKKRDLTIDLIKGLGIILMVMGHANAPFAHFFTGFHMPVFFIASGYLFRVSPITQFDKLISYCVRKVKTLWVPYFCFSSAFILFHNAFLKLGIYSFSHASKELSITQYDYFTITDIIKGIFKSAIFKAGTEMGGPLWFLGALFIALVLYASTDFLLNQLSNSVLRKVISVILALCSLLLGYFCFLRGMSLFGLARVFSAYPLLLIGQSLYQHKVMEYVFGKKRAVARIIAVMICSFLILSVLDQTGTVVLSYNSIQNPVFFIVLSISGWVLLYSIALLLQRLSFVGNKIIAYISVHSISVLALHALCFKLVNLFAVIIGQQEIYKIAAFPVLMSGNGWWILYTFIGILVPLCLNKFFQNTKKFLISYFENNTVRYRND